MRKTGCQMWQKYERVIDILLSAHYNSGSHVADGRSARSLCRSAGVVDLATSYKIVTGLLQEPERRIMRNDKNWSWKQNKSEQKQNSNAKLPGNRRFWKFMFCIPLFISKTQWDRLHVPGRISKIKIPKTRFWERTGKIEERSIVCLQYAHFFSRFISLSGRWQ